MWWAPHPHSLCWCKIHMILSRFAGVWEYTQRSWFRKEHASASPLPLKEALVLRVCHWIGKPMPSHGLQIRHKVSSSITENVPLLVLKPYCIPQSSLRPKAEHHLLRLGTEYMWNKNDGGGLLFTSGDLSCLTLNESAGLLLGSAVCCLWDKSHSSLVHKQFAKQQLVVSVFGCTLSKSHGSVCKRELNNTFGRCS